MTQASEATLTNTINAAVFYSGKPVGARIRNKIHRSCDNEQPILYRTCVGASFWDNNPSCPVLLAFFFFLLDINSTALK